MRKDNRVETRACIQNNLVKNLCLPFFQSILLPSLRYARITLEVTRIDRILYKGCTLCNPYNLYCTLCTMSAATKRWILEHLHHKAVHLFTVHS
jgi:hypothetical protein